MYTFAYHSMYCKYFSKKREQMFSFICIGISLTKRIHFEMEQVYKAVTQSIFLFVSLVSICDEYVVVF